MVMEEIKIDIPKGYEFAGVDDNKQQVVFTKILAEYPKTYKECCSVLNIPTDECYIDIDVPLDYNRLLSAFTELLICRDAYWKIAGEQMGLGKPWEPDYKDGCTKYTITITENKIYTDVSYIFSHVLIFPTEEIRDAFCKNFKELIEKCKELL